MRWPTRDFNLVCGLCAPVRAFPAAKGMPFGAMLTRGYLTDNTEVAHFR
jgi:hypothetical protein